MAETGIAPANSAAAAASTTDPSSDPSSAVAVGYRAMLDVIAAAEPSVARAITGELASQRRQLKLIASENYASPAVLMAMGTWLSDKYAEGTVGHRFYAGCELVDEVETLASGHARELFGADHAYVQPHSGIDANLVAYWAILARRVERPFLDASGTKNVDGLSPADWARLRGEFGAQRMMGMALDAGGHLTHGFRNNISGKMFDQASYGTDPETGLLDYDVIAAQAREFRPLILVAGYSAYPRNPDFARLREIADEVGATFMVDMAHFAGLVAGEVLTGNLNPVPHAEIVTSTTHKSLRGPRGGLVLCTAGLRPLRRPGLPAGARRPAPARDRGQGRRPGRGAPARASPTTRRASWPTPTPWPTGCCGAACTWSPAAPTTTSCWPTSRPASGSPAARPRPRCSRPAS